MVLAKATQKPTVPAVSWGERVEAVERTIETRLREQKLAVGSYPMAEAMAQSAGHASNGNGPNASDPSGLRVDRQQPSRGGQALFAGDGK